MPFLNKFYVFTTQDAYITREQNHRALNYLNNN